MPAQTIAKVCRSQVGWEGEVSFDVMKEGAVKEVAGRDNQKCTITLRVRIMGEKQLSPPDAAVVDNSEKLLEVAGVINVLFAFACRAISLFTRFFGRLLHRGLGRCFTLRDGAWCAWQCCL